jgi:DNA-binding NarL/FixJ family response regulator
MSNNFSILIVDDNSGFVNRMKDILDELDSIITIHSAGNYEEAYKLLDEKKPNLVLLDIRLPGKSGVSLLRKINNSNANCQVIMNSNYSNDHYRQQCKELGAHYFLDKTNDFEIVPELVRKLALDSYKETNSHTV